MFLIIVVQMLNPALRRLRQEDEGFKAILDYTYSEILSR